MKACPPCPAPVAGAPFIQLDHRVAVWATETLSSAGLRAWLRLLTHYRNDRPLPQLSERALARIAGLSAGAAHKVRKELRPLLVFSGEVGAEEAAAIGPPLVPGSHCSQDGQGAHSVSSGCSQREQNRSQREQRRSRREQPTISIQEIEQERKNPPPTSSTHPPGGGTATADEEESIQGRRIQGEGTANSRPSGLRPPSAPGAQADQALAVAPALAPVAAELLAYWAGKRGARTPMAFAAQQAELMQIVADGAGGIEAAREQLRAAAMKDWDFIRYGTWKTWRQSQPQPLVLEEEDFNPGTLIPGLKAFERRYRATYGHSASSGDVLCAFYSYTERLEREGGLRDLNNLDTA